jgi:chemotaxis methyl-accepting protein methylase
MHKLAIRASMLEQEAAQLRLIMERQTGVLLDIPSEILSDAVSELIERSRFRSVSDLLEKLRSSDQECEILAERLFSAETRFFRFPAAFESFAKTVLPEIQARQPQDHARTLRIWSAGCSSGEEAYSIAMTVCEARKNSGSGWNVHIVGSDIRRSALQIAERALYHQSALDPVPGQLVQTYFAKVGEHLLAKPRLRNLVTFSQMNLTRPAYIGQFHCIFCMDVLPHFSAAQRAALARRLHLYLQPGGYLFLGAGEKLPATDLSFERKESDECKFYRKPAAVAAKSGS